MTEGGEVTGRRYAFLASEHLAYAQGEPVAISLWAHAQTGPTRLMLHMFDHLGLELLQQKKGEPEFTKRLVPGRPIVTSIPDLRHSFDLTRPGQYKLRLTGQPGGQGPESVLSDDLTIVIQNSSERAREVTPLAEIWAVQMPSTRAINLTLTGNPPAFVSAEGGLGQSIIEALGENPKPSLGPGQGFAVAGHGLNALKEARAVLVGGRPRSASLPVGAQTSLVFYSFSYGAYIQLGRVEVSSDLAAIFYRVEPHKTKEVTAHLALVPLPPRTAGRLRVEIKPMFDAQNPSAPDIDWPTVANDVVCHSFSVVIQ
jgi:hypothetical protein